ncbi:MAG TPA: biopolymer transporter ExbD [Nitrospiria bacterium]|nr:biopolymer transporter ExbD [Nitrospiria bacterium]
MRKSHMRARSRFSERRKGATTVSTVLTLTSLVDLFTNLVLFLLYNFSGEASAIPAAEHMKLPESLAQLTPQTTLTVMITRSDILVDGTKVAEIGQVLKESDLLIPALKKEMDYAAERGKYFSNISAGKPFEGRVTILGDKNIPFRLLEKVMYTCSQAEFGQIDLAVIQKESAG